MLLLATLLPLGCKPRPLVCAAQGIFQVAPAGQPDGGLPEHATQLGPKVELAHLETHPTHLSFLEGNHVRVEWLSYGHVYSRTEALYSPGEGAARSIK